MTEGYFKLDLPLPSEWRAIEQLRAGVMGFLQALFPDAPEYCEVLAMIVRELCENALKYGDWKEPARRAAFRLELEGSPTSVQVTVSNPVPAGAPVHRCLELVSRISQAPTPQQAYVERMREVAAQEQLGGLGLARIAYESNGRLSAALAPDARLSLTVLTRPSDFAQRRAATD